MKTFSKLKEELNRFKNTKEVVKGVFSGKGIGEIKQDMQSGKINIGKFKKLTSWMKKKFLEPGPILFLPQILFINISNYTSPTLCSNTKIFLFYVHCNRIC